jgi:C4-dicarboxylate-binding protein DctP
MLGRSLARSQSTQINKSGAGSPLMSSKPAGIPGGWLARLWRKIFMRKWIIAAAAAAIFLAPGAASAQAPIVIKFSHVVAPNTPKGKGAEKFKELAEKYTDGKVKVEVYHNSTLYKGKEELEAMQLGAVQMLAPSNSKFGPIGIRDFEVFDLPFLLPNLTALRKVTEGPIGQKMLKEREPKGMVGLAYWDNGFK